MATRKPTGKAKGRKPARPKQPAPTMRELRRLGRLVIERLQLGLSNQELTELFYLLRDFRESSARGEGRA